MIPKKTDPYDHFDNDGSIDGSTNDSDDNNDQW